MSPLRLGVAVAVLVAAAMMAGRSPALAASCPASPPALSPAGSPTTRFTMLIRVNKVENARTYASRDEAAGGLADRIRPQDLFLVNTRYGGSSPAEWSRIVGVLAAAFPCNRIVALNGLGGAADSPGYAYALRGNPRIWALLTDWERLDWAEAQLSNPYLGPWSGRFRRTDKRVRRWIGLLTSPGSPARAGVVPPLRSKWDYGQLARSISGPHRQIAPARRGLLSVQTQDTCAEAGARGMKAAVGGLLRQYKLANFSRTRRSKGRRARYRRRKWMIHPGNLSVQVSFTGTPQPWSGLALLRTSPVQAAGCTRAALRHGAGAILFWASPNSMRAMLSLPAMCALRPGYGC